ncbi:MAG: adenylate cyclase [Chlorobiaceae bacterium]|nr:adenylate cyclase [Chlorobiaceae bacterium]
MPVNLEIKAHIPNLCSAEKIAIEIGAHKAGVLIQTDTYFNSANGRLKLREFPDKNAELIFYKRDEDSIQRASNYSIYKTIDSSGLKEILTASYGIRAVIEKRRMLYLFGATRVHLDEVKGLGSFIEFEIPIISDDQAAREQMNFLIDRFRLLPDQFITKSYIDLMLLKPEQVS